MDLPISRAGGSVSHNDYRAATAWIIWSGVTMLVVGIVGLIIVTPLAKAHGYGSFAGSVYNTFSYVCHQIPERSFHLAGHKFAVCSRCTGLYSGLALAALIYPLTRSLQRTETPRLVWLILSTVPLAIDFVLGYFSIWTNTHLSRFVTGGVLGGVAMFFILPGLIEITSRARQFLTRSSPASPQ